MIEQVYLHIGLHKTGSTTIQEFLGNNVDRLLELGYLYPTHNLPRHHQLVTSITSGKPTKGRMTWDWVWKVANKSEARNLILSSEAFEKFNSDDQFQVLKRKLNGIPTKVIIYVREQTARIESIYTQLLKSGKEHRQLADVLADEKDRARILENNNLLRRFQIWNQHFDVSDIAIRPVEKSQIADLTHDILYQCNINDFSKFSTVQAMNTKPSLNQLKILYRLNNFLNKNQGSQSRQEKLKNFTKLKGHLKHFHQNNPNKESFRLMPYELAMDIREHFMESNQALAKFYPNLPATLFQDEITKYTHVNLDSPVDNSEEIVELLIHFMATDLVR